MSKADTMKARLPRGFIDRDASEIAASHRMLEAIRATYELYGFEALETPFVEYTEALGKFLPDLDRPNEGVFSFQDDDEQWLSLRYDLTAPLARHVAERLDAQSLTLPYRSYRAGWVFRNEKPGPGRFRQFMQFDADTIGSASPAADAEICMMMAETLEAVGIPRGSFIVKVNSRKILDGLMEEVGLDGHQHEKRRLIVLRALDKFDKIGLDGVRQLLTSGRRDESGDFTRGAYLAPDQADKLLYLLGLQSDAEVLVSYQEHHGEVVPPESGGFEFQKEQAILHRLQIVTFGSACAMAGINELQTLISHVRRCGFGADRIRIDPSIVRGLEYYTGPVFEAELTFPVQDEAGKISRFGSVAGGGRYDGLVGRFRSESVPATGFSIGVSRLLAALKYVGSRLVASAETGPVVVLVMDRDRLGDYQAMAAELRASGIRAEVYLGSGGMKAQMRYADRRGAPCVIIQGSQEKDRGEVQIKDLVAGRQEADARADASNAEYRAARLAQISVPEAELVDRLREMLTSVDR